METFLQLAQRQFTPEEQAAINADIQKLDELMTRRRRRALKEIGSKVPDHIASLTRELYGADSSHVSALKAMAMAKDYGDVTTEHALMVAYLEKLERALGEESEEITAFLDFTVRL